MREIEVAYIIADFDAVLDQVERGETIAIFRDGRLIAYFKPEPKQGAVSPDAPDLTPR
jgi:antitoxin (DNA-binding transcriptional repressor) of toxin-antitoxin stability system